LAVKQKSSAVASKKEAPKSWYDYPEYYDAGFAEGVDLEADFYEKAFARFVPFPVKNIFEPGCGSGRLVVELAQRGFNMTGLDLSQSMLDYCKTQLAAGGAKAKLIRGDMKDFKLPKPIDAAINPINTFRHLLTEDAAKKHLECVADSLKVGGVYILGLHLWPTDGDLFGSERWQVQYKDARIYYTLTVEESDPKTRVEQLRLTMTVKRPKETFRFVDRLHLRLYTAAQIKALIKSVPKFKIAGVYDFWYEIDEPCKLDSEICDTVLVLQRV
jgi:SAM-dependent methyltransferase